MFNCFIDLYEYIVCFHRPYEHTYSHSHGEEQDEREQHVASWSFPNIQQGGLDKVFRFMCRPRAIVEQLVRRLP